MALSHCRSSWAGFVSFVAVVAGSTALHERAWAVEGEQKIVVRLDQAKVIGLPKGPSQIILGNPLIVGVTQLPEGGAVLTGKAFGETNLIVLDGHGQVVVNTTIRVELPANTDVVAQRGAQRSTYGCGTGCELRMQLGDGGEVAQGAANAIRTRNGLATQDPSAPAAATGSKGHQAL